MKTTSIALATLVGMASAVPVYVMLPLDAVNDDRTVKDPDTLRAQFDKFADAGVEGIMSDVWWGLVERDGPQQYNFTAYVDIAEMAADAGLSVQFVLSAHQCGGNVGDTCDIPLPQWVRDVGNSNPDIWYTDAEGHRDQEYISLFVDEEALFDGRSPVDIYTDFAKELRSSLGDLVGKTVTEIEVGLGPAGEMRYPGYQEAYWSFPGVGEFQSYSSYALDSVAAAASAAGHPEWGMAGGPNNAGDYNSVPSQTGFFGNGNDNYNSDYGKFFLNWYQQNLIDHGDRVLKSVQSVFSDITLSAKIAGIHWWHADASHAAELTSGYYNYDEIAEMLAKYGVEMDFTCLEMQDSEQGGDCGCQPYELVQETKAAAFGAGTGYTGENALPRYDQTAYNTIKSQSSGISGFTYLRLDDTLLQDDNWNTFTNFVNDMKNIH